MLTSHTLALKQRSLLHRVVSHPNSAQTAQLRIRSFSASSSVSAPADQDSSSSDSPSSQLFTLQRTPVTLYPLGTPQRTVPPHIHKPPYAATGRVPYSPLQESIALHGPESANRMREAARLARRVLDIACSLAAPGRTTDEMDAAVHDAFVQAGAYPSPLNYCGFPKSFCTSVNEVVCHGIPDTRPLQFGDVVSFDVSCFLNGVHGDNCATIIVGDEQEENEIGTDWRGVPYRSRKNFVNEQDEEYFVEARRLVSATRESLYAGIAACRPGGCLTAVGAAIHEVADRNNYGTVEAYRGHGICSEFHCPPFVKHFRNDEYLELIPGMIFTIEPMLTQGSPESRDWDDNWTVSTVDGSLAAQFEHTVYITEDGVEILTLPE